MLLFGMRMAFKFRKALTRKTTQGLLLALLASTIFNLSAVPLGFAQTTQIAVVAPTGDITVPTQFNVDINVTDVTDLYAWQIKLYYDPAALRWVNATYPPGHVFDGKPFGPMPPFNGSGYEPRVYLLLTASLEGHQPGFSGGGTLCRISFEAKAQGTSTLNFSRPLGGDTFLWNSRLSDIAAALVDGSVNVIGADTRPPTAVSLRVDKSVIFLGDSAVISGTINVTVPDGTQVYIEYWNYSDKYWVRWLPVTTVITTSSQYSCIWHPAEGGLIGIRSRWTGSSFYKPATSEAKSIAISTLGPYDLNGDEKIDGKDIAVVAQAFGSLPGYPRWDPRTDLNQDNKIEGKDIALVGRNFGKTVYRIPAYLQMFPQVIIKPTVLGNSIVGKPDALFEVHLLINNVDPRDFLIMAQFNITFNATLLRVNNVFEGTFMNNLAWAPYGTILMWYEDPGMLTGFIMILPNMLAEWDMAQFPSGNGLVATIRFEAIHQSETSYDTSDLLLGGIYGEFFVSANETYIPYGSPISSTYIIYGPDY